MRHSRTRRAAAAIAAAAAIVALLFPYPAAAASPDLPATADSAGGAVPAAELAAALQRDQGLTADQARDRLAAVAAAAEAEQELRTALGADFAGAWLADDGTLVVAATDPAAADRVRAAGAEPRLVAHSLRQLDSAKATLDRAEPPSTLVTGWYVDVESNQVIVQARPGGQAEAHRFVASSGVAGRLVEVELVTQRPRLLKYPLREGDPFYVGSARCTIGFLVTLPNRANGYVTAGHCGSAGASTLGFNFQPQGTFRASIFPGRDAAVVQVSSNWTPAPRFDGSTEAPIGATVCKLGSTTGLTCGTITAKNQTINYPQGTVYGLTRTTICAEPGDSGAPVFSAADNQAQGTVSGGSGNCTIGGVTFFQPVNPVLAAWGLALQTA